MSYSETATFTPAAYTFDNEHRVLGDPTAVFGGLLALAIMIKTFFENLPGMTGAWGDAGAPYPWDSVRIAYFVIASIVIAASAILAIIVIVFALAGNSCVSGCCTGAPLGRKSFRHIVTVLNVHLSHFLYGWLIIAFRWGFDKFFTAGVQVPVDSGVFDGGYLNTFYYVHAMEFIAGLLLGVGSFLGAAPYLWFAEADSRYAKKVTKGQ